MAYNDAALSDQDRARVAALGEQWKSATAAGNSGLANQYHQQAEAIRAGYGYSGGLAGNEYHPIDMQGQPVKEAPAKVATATNQSGYLQDLYAAKKESALAGLKSAYDSSLLELDAAEKKISPYYQGLRNQAAADAAV